MSEEFTTPCFCSYSKVGRFANARCPTHASRGRENLKDRLRWLIEPQLPEGRIWRDVVGVYKGGQGLKYDVIMAGRIDSVKITISTGKDVGAPKEEKHD